MSGGEVPSETGMYTAMTTQWTSQNAQHCLLGRSEGMHLRLWSLGAG